MKEITVKELKAKIDSKDNFQLIDVREPHEVEICAIGGELIPMGEIMNSLDKLTKDKSLIIHCRSGARSGAIVQALTALGFENACNLKGGILAWINEIDPSLQAY